MCDLLHRFKKRICFTYSDLITKVTLEDSSARIDIRGKGLFFFSQNSSGFYFIKIVEFFFPSIVKDFVYLIWIKI